MRLRLKDPQALFKEISRDVEFGRPTMLILKRNTVIAEDQEPVPAPRTSCHNRGDSQCSQSVERKPLGACERCLRKSSKSLSHVEKVPPCEAVRELTTTAQQRCIDAD